MNTSFLYEPYFISLIVALIFTFVYYFIRRNKQKTNESENQENNGKKKQEMSPEIRSILVFISSYSFFTGLLYILKNYLFPHTDLSISDIPLPSISSVTENLQDIKENILEKVEETLSTSTPEEKVSLEDSNDVVIAGKKRNKLKDKESLRHMNSKNAKFADHDVDFHLHSFDLP